MKLYAFDVDETLEISGGPVKFIDLVRLREQGHILALCGNWAVVTQGVHGWDMLFSAVGPLGCTKTEFLQQLRKYVPATEYFFIGNDHSRGSYSSPDDADHVKGTGFEFISELDFKI